MSYRKIEKPYKTILKWHNIKMLVFDFDGVLTDGRIIYDSSGSESKNFDAHDGMGFLILRQTDLISVVITGRNSNVVQRRCEDLGINYVFQGVHNKLERISQLLEELKLSFENVLYMGDDWNDIPVMFKAALSVCPADAEPEIKSLVDHVTKHDGGRGAARECIEYVLTHKGMYEQAVVAYINTIS